MTLFYGCGKHEAVTQAIRCPICYPEIRQFETGATRDIDTDKHDPEGFIHPLVIVAYNEYMHKHRIQTDGSLRAADNWQRGIPQDAYMKSMWRHFLDVWLYHRGCGYKAKELQVEALTALMFNVMGYLYEVLKQKDARLDPRQPVSSEPFSGLQGSGELLR